jgi:SH3-like domain-containing protein
LVKIKKCKDKWCKVLTGEFKGWVRRENLWGLL